MTRRSISLVPFLETWVRKFQASMLTKLDRDVTFTEALNLLLLGSLIEGGDKYIHDQIAPEAVIAFLDGNLSDEALLDVLQDKMLVKLYQQSQQQQQLTS